jgi:uncharacterized protein DUF6624
MNQAVYDELLQLQDDDQRVRGEYLNCPAPDDDPQALAILDEMMHIDARNVARFSAIITKYGWPGRSLVGDDGCRAAWILAQHNSWHEALLQRCLDLVDVAVTAGEAPLLYAEQLRDTLYRRQGKTYLSPMSKVLPGGVVSISPFSDEDRIAMDARRAAVGWSTVAEWEEELRRPIGDVPLRRGSALTVEESRRRLWEYYRQYATESAFQES